MFSLNLSISGGVRMPSVQPGMMVETEIVCTIRAEDVPVPDYFTIQRQRLEATLASYHNGMEDILGKSRVENDLSNLNVQIRDYQRNHSGPSTKTVRARVVRVEPEMERFLWMKSLTGWRITLEGVEGTFCDNFYPTTKNSRMKTLGWTNTPPLAYQDQTLEIGGNTYCVVTQSALVESSFVYLTDASRKVLVSLPCTKITGLLPSAAREQKTKVSPDEGTGAGQKHGATNPVSPNEESGTRQNPQQIPASIPEKSGSQNASDESPTHPEHIRSSKDPREIAEYMDGFVVAQPQATRKLAIAMVDQQYRPEGTRKPNVLVVGPTGCGKTALAQLAADMMDVPFAEAKLAGRTTEGYKGANLSEVFQDLLPQRKHGNFRRAVVLLDEIDKVARQEPNGGFGRSLQAEMIGWLESAQVNASADVRQPVKVDTTNFMFIGAGAFVGMERIIAKRIGAGINFAEPVGGEVRAELLSQLAPDDLIQFGLMPELVGRFAVFTYVNPLGENELVDIMKNGHKSPVREQMQVLQRVYGVEMALEDGVYRLIASVAAKQGTGARAIDSITRTLFEGIKYNVRDYTKNGNTRITLTEQAAKEMIGRKCLRR